MKLNKEQIQQIEDYLTIKKVKHIDIRFEILDHIISDIEFSMEIKNFSFDSAFEEVKLKWNKSLINSSNIWFGFGTFRPAILIKKSLKIYKPLLIKSIFTVFVCTLLIYVILENFKKLFLNNKGNISNLISIFLVIYMCSVLYWYIRIKLTKFHSTYGFLFNKRIVSNIFTAVIFFLVFNNNYVNKEGVINYPLIALLIFLFTTLVVGNYLFKKHFEAIKTFRETK